MAFPVSEDRIRIAEEKLGRQLPSVLRERLMADNGGEVEDDRRDGWILHPVRDDTDRKRLTRTANDIVRETESAREQADFPSGAVAIAEDGTGDALILLPGSDEIYIWSHEGEPLVQTVLTMHP
ncbi:SMI1/KNR4 family protein [Gordonia hydrophobica]|uniref:SMI1/KNR4 family protein n=1 Tax=Gordonia hydrophobica TaxID=40516 RepID=A0ABZ2TXF1_9ACTN|nr:SMI1/KNR4 family protein [Gordonia hydrophobica]MBM7366364.1 hypothetical protein [Gordonia hydrophobica]